MDDACLNEQTKRRQILNDAPTNKKYDMPIQRAKCTNCGRSSSSITQVRVKELSGRSYGFTTTMPNILYREGGSKSRNTGAGRRSVRTYYRYVTKSLCLGCYARHERKKLLKWALWGGAAIAAYLILHDSPANKAASPQIKGQVERSSQDEFAGSPAAPQRTPSAEALPNVPPNAAIPGDQRPADPRPPSEPLAVVTDLANIRLAPNNGAITGQLMAGEQLSIVETSGAWAKVRKESVVIGWIYRPLLEELPVPRGDRDRRVFDSRTFHE